MDDRQSLVLAGVAAEIWQNADRYEKRTFTIDELGKALTRRWIGEYLTHEDLLLFKDYAIEYDIADVIETPYAKPRLRFSAWKVRNRAEAADKKSPLYYWTTLGNSWLSESIENVSRQIVATGRPLIPPAVPEPDGSDIEKQSELLDEEGHALLDERGEALTLESGRLAPAAARYVPLDHNSRQYREAIATLDDAVKALQGINEELDFETSSKIVELAAGRKLLEAPQIDLRFVEAMLIEGLVYLAKRTFNAAIDMAIKVALEMIRALFGMR